MFKLELSAKKCALKCLIIVTNNTVRMVFIVNETVLRPPSGEKNSRKKMKVQFKQQSAKNTYIIWGWTSSQNQSFRRIHDFYIIIKTILCILSLYLLFLKLFF